MRSGHVSRSLWPFVAALALAAFCLNWPWEMAQMGAYVEMAGRGWWDVLLPCTQAALGDVALTFAVWAVGALAAADVCWGMTGRWNVYLVAALLGGACAVAYEWKALGSGRWHYTEHMPVVPVLEVGLWPLLQLSLLVPLALGLARWWTARRVTGPGSPSLAA